MIPDKIDRYVISGELGRGGMATVYRARDPRFKRDVAVKVLPREFLHEPTFRERFDREAQTIATLEHPAIVPVYDFGEEEGQPYLVMRYMPGGSLSDRLKSGPIPIPEAAMIINRLSSALERAHQSGVIHRDLKPQNILFDQYNEAHLSDFGSAHLMQASTALTGDSIVGTPAYMSPEQARGDAELDGRSDIYALGAILFEMLTGQQPYEADTPMGVAVKHITEPVPRILEVKSDLPPAIERIIERAMAKDREARFSRPKDLSRELARLASKVQGSTVDTSGTHAPPTGRRARPAELQRVEPSRSEDRRSSEGSAIERPASDQIKPASDVGSGAAPPPRVEPTSGGFAPVRPGRPAGLLGLPRWVWALGVVILVAGVCGVILIGGGTLAALSNLANPPLGETGQPSTAAPVSSILFEDSFVDPNSGWDRFSDDDATTDYAAGGYRILVNKENSYYWANPDLHLTDIIVEVETTKTAGPDDNDFGVICRYRDSENFYFFLISSDGYYSINKYIEGELQIVGLESYEFDEVIRQGSATNVLQASCIGDQLSLTVNGKLLYQVQDADFIAGDVGLIAGTFDEPGTEILFQNFKVSRP